MVLMLEVKRTGLDEYGPNLKMLVAGSNASTRTKFAATFPNPIFACAEAPLRSIADKGIPYVQIKNTTQLIELGKCLKQDPEVRDELLGTTVNTVVLDHFDEIQRIFMRERAIAQHDEVFSYKDYSWLGEQMTAMLRAYRNLDLHVVVLVNIRETRDEETGQVFFKPGLGGQFGDQIGEYLDFSLLAVAKSATKVVDDEPVHDDVRYLQTFPSKNNTWIDDTSGTLPGEFSLNFGDDFDRLSDFIYSKDVGDSEKIKEVQEADIEAKIAMQSLKADVLADMVDDNTEADMEDGRIKIKETTT
jgi:hypothetical protein